MVTEIKFYNCGSSLSLSIIQRLGYILMVVARTRLYRIGISNHLEETTEYFEIFGELEQGWERFKRNTNYRSFVLKLKDEVN
jgi:hypothetical protein